MGRRVPRAVSKEAVPAPVDGQLCPPGSCVEDDASTTTHADAFPRPSPTDAYRSTANRVARSVDRARQQVMRLGFRPYNVDLVFTRWTGKTRGDGHEEVFKRIVITPSPKIIDLSSISMSPVATGLMPMGSIRLDKVSVCYTSDILMGRLGVDQTSDPYAFYYEVYEDGRTGKSERMKFRPSSQPNRRPYGWSILLERISQDADRDGVPATSEQQS